MADYTYDIAYIAEQVLILEDPGPAIDGDVFTNSQGKTGRLTGPDAIMSWGGVEQWFAAAREAAASNAFAPPAADSVDGANPNDFPIGGRVKWVVPHKDNYVLNPELAMAIRHGFSTVEEYRQHLANEAIANEEVDYNFLPVGIEDTATGNDVEFLPLYDPSAGWSGAQLEEESIANAQAAADETGNDIDTTTDTDGVGNGEPENQQDASFFADSTYQSVVDGWNQKIAATSQKLSGLIPFIELYVVFADNDIIYSVNTNQYSDIKSRLIEVTFTGGAEEAGQSGAFPAQNNPKGLEAAGVSRNSKVARIAGDILPQLSSDSFTTTQGSDDVSYNPYTSFKGVAGVSDLSVQRGGAGSYNIKYDMNLTLPNPEVINEKYEYSKMLLLNSTFLLVYGWNVRDTGFMAGHTPPVLIEGSTNPTPVPLDTANGGFWRASLVKLTNFDFSFDNVGHMIGKLTFLNSQGSYLSTISSGSVGPTVMKQLEQPSERLLPLMEARQGAIWTNGVPWSPGTYSNEQLSSDRLQTSLEDFLIDAYRSRDFNQTQLAQITELWGEDTYADQEALSDALYLINAQVDAEVQVFWSRAMLQLWKQDISSVYQGQGDSRYSFGSIGQLAFPDGTPKPRNLRYDIEIVGGETIEAVDPFSSTNRRQVGPWRTPQDFLQDELVVSILSQPQYNYTVTRGGRTIGDINMRGAPLTLMVGVHQEDPIVVNGVAQLSMMNEFWYKSLRYQQIAAQDERFIYVPPPITYREGITHEDMLKATERSLNRWSPGLLDSLSDAEKRGVIEFATAHENFGDNRNMGTLYDARLAEALSIEEIQNQQEQGDTPYVSSGGDYIENMPRFGTQLQSYVRDEFSQSTNPNFANFYKNGGIIDNEVKRLIESTSVISVPVMRSESALELFPEENRLLRDIPPEDKLVTLTFWNMAGDDLLAPLRKVQYYDVNLEVAIINNKFNTAEDENISFPLSHEYIPAEGFEANHELLEVYGIPAGNEGRYDAMRMTITRSGYIFRETRMGGDIEVDGEIQSTPWTEQPVEFLGNIADERPFEERVPPELIGYLQMQATDTVGTGGSTPDQNLKKNIELLVRSIEEMLEQAIRHEKEELRIENLQSISLANNVVYNVHMQPVYFFLGSVLEAFSRSINGKLKFKYSPLPTGQAEHGSFSIPIPEFDTSVLHVLNAQIEEKEKELSRITGEDESFDTRVARDPITGEILDDVVTRYGGELTRAEAVQVGAEQLEESSQLTDNIAAWKGRASNFIENAREPALVRHFRDESQYTHMSVWLHIDNWPFNSASSPIRVIESVEYYASGEDTGEVNLNTIKWKLDGDGNPLVAWDQETEIIQSVFLRAEDDQEGRTPTGEEYTEIWGPPPNIRSLALYGPKGGVYDSPPKYIDHNMKGDYVGYPGSSASSNWEGKLPSKYFIEKWDGVDPWDRIVLNFPNSDADGNPVPMGAYISNLQQELYNTNLMVFYDVTKTNRKGTDHSAANVPTYEIINWRRRVTSRGSAWWNRMESLYDKYIEKKPTAENPQAIQPVNFAPSGTEPNSTTLTALAWWDADRDADAHHATNIEDLQNDLIALRQSKTLLDLETQYGSIDLKTTYELPVNISTVKQIMMNEPRAPAHNVIVKLIESVSQTLPNVRVSKRTTSDDPSYVDIFVASLNVGGEIKEVFSERKMMETNADEGLAPGEQIREGRFAYDALQQTESGFVSSNKIIVCNFGVSNSLVETFGLSSRLDPNAFASYRLPAVVGGVSMNLNQVIQENLGEVGGNGILTDIANIMREGQFAGKEALASLNIITLDENNPASPVTITEDNERNLQNFLMTNNDTNEIEAISATLIQDLMAQNSTFYNKMITLQNEQFRLSSNTTMNNGRAVGDQFYGNVLSTFLRTATVTIHGICGINAFNFIYIKGLLSGVEGVYVVVSVNESIATGSFTTTLECKLVEYYNNDEQTNPLAYKGSVNLQRLQQAAEYAKTLGEFDSDNNIFGTDGYEDLLLYAYNPEGRYTDL